MSEPRVTVWFDGACPLCTREIALFRRLDRKGAIEFVDVASPGAACPLNRQALLERFHAREKDQPIVSGAAAFAAMWRVIPILSPFGQIARAPWILPALEWIYCRFLEVRPRLQRWHQKPDVGSPSRKQ